MSDPVSATGTTTATAQSVPETSTGTPLSDGWGLTLDYNLLGLLSTTLTEGGLGHMGRLTLSINPDLADRYLFTVGGSWAHSQGKILPSADSLGTYTDNTHWNLMIGMGHERRLHPFFNNSGGLWGSIYSSTVPMIGGGGSSSAQPDRTVGGEDFQFPTSSTTTFDISTFYAIGFEFKGNRFPAFRIAPTLGYGLIYSQNGEWSRLNLSLGFVASFGSADASTAENPTDYDPHALGIAYGTYAKLHSIIQAVLMNKVLGDRSKQLEDAGLLLGGLSDPGSMEDLRVLEGASALFGGMAFANSREYFLTIGTWNPLPLALEGLGGVLLLALTQNSSGMGTGVADLLNAAGMSIYMMWGADKPSGRESLGDSMNHRLLSSAIIGYALNTAMFIIGAGVVADDSSSTGGWTILNGAAQANFGVASSPDPSNSGAVDNTRYDWAPISYYYSQSSGGHENSGMRSGISISRSWNGWPVYTDAYFMTHALRFDNVFKRLGAEPTEPYGDTMLPSEVGASIGLHYENTWFFIGAGFDTCIQYGSGLGATAGVGGSANIALKIPFNGQENGSGMTIGAHFRAHKLLPDGWDLEVAPELGALIHF